MRASPATEVAIPTDAFTHRLKIVGIAMVGNEADIVEAFVRENCRVLDHLLIAEHHTMDGTAEILEALVQEGLPISVERVEDFAFEQSKIINRLIWDGIERFEPDWILPLDADEIIECEGRVALESDLLALADQHGRMPWVIHVPTALDDPDESHPLRRIAHRYACPPPDPEENHSAWKLAMNVSLIRSYRDRYALEKGNHRLVFLGTGGLSAQPVQPLANVRLRHFPVRSYDQLTTKISLGISQERLAASRLESKSVHWPPIWQALLAGQDGIHLLQSACRMYLDPGRKTAEQTVDVPIVRDPLQAHGELRHAHRKVSAQCLLMRWIARQLSVEGKPAGSPAPAGTDIPHEPRRAATIWKTHLRGAGLDAHYHDSPRRELIKFLPPRINSLLDIGCAAGATSLLIKERHPGCRTTGIELNPDAAALAAKRLDQVLCADIEGLDFEAAGLPAAGFDLILLADVLEHLRDPWRVVERLRPLLAPGGRLVACLPNIFNLGVLEELVQGSWHYDREGILDITHLRFFAREDMLRLFTETGYAVESVHALRTPAKELPPYQREGLYGLRTPHLVLCGLPPTRLEEALAKQFVIVAKPGAEP